MIGSMLIRLKKIAISDLPDLVFLGSLGIILAANLRFPKFINAQSITQWVFIGICFGWLLAITRWRGWFCACYHSLVVLLTGVQSTAKIFPAVTQLLNPYWDWSESVRLRILIFGQRASAWKGMVSSGNLFQDPVINTMLLGGAMVLVCGWLAWWSVRKRKPVISAIPAGFLLIYSLQAQNQKSHMVIAFIAVVLLTCVYAAFINCQKRWDSDKVDWPYFDSLLPEWVGGAIIIVGIICLAGYLIPWVATPEGWERIMEALESKTQTLTQVQSTSSPPAGKPGTSWKPDDQAKEFYLDIPLVDSVGDAPTTDQTILFWVYVNDPPPPPDQAQVKDYVGHRYYWRNGIYSAYHGFGWDEVKPDPVAVKDNQLSAGEKRYVLEQEFLILTDHSNQLLSMNFPFQASADVQIQYLNDGSALIYGDSDTYRVLSSVTEVTVSDLMTAGLDYPDEIIKEYAALTENIPERVTNLAVQIAGTTGTPYEKAVRIQDFLRSNYPYSLDVPRPPVNQDVVDYFLFDAQKGFCSYYASAMTVMLRVVGVPARVVTGYAGGIYDYDRNGYKVPASAAHAWVEVYFPKYGWVEFEPTASYPAIRRPEGENKHESSVDDTAISAVERWIYRAMIAFMGVLGGLITIWIVIKLTGMTRININTTNKIEKLYWVMRRDLSMSGYKYVGTATPLEYFNFINQQTGIDAKIIKFVGDLTYLYQLEVFSPHRPVSKHYLQAKVAQAKAIPGLAYLWFRYVLRRIRKTDKNSL